MNLPNLNPPEEETGSGMDQLEAETPALIRGRDEHMAALGKLGFMELLLSAPDFSGVDLTRDQSLMRDVDRSPEPMSDERTRGNG